MLPLGLDLKSALNGFLPNFPHPLEQNSEINNGTFHFSIGSIPSTSHIISCSNDSFVDLHQVKIFLSNIVTSHFRSIYKDILATSDLVEFNSVEYVWISVIDIKSRERVPQCRQLIFRIVPEKGCILNLFGRVCSKILLWRNNDYWEYS